nr:hypothetical protein [Pseudonocardia acidicola]
MGRAARRGCADLDVADVEAAVNATAVLCAQPRSDVDPAAVAEQIGATAAAMAQLELPAAARGAVDWSGFGALIPVLSGSPGAGGSVLAAALADALQLGGRCALLVDAADPSRSGLAVAASSEGPWVHQPHAQLVIRYSWRGYALLARLESSLPTITPGMVPPPPAWLPELDPLHATIVDIGHDGWRAAANPLAGAGGWLRRGTPAPRPLLVVRPTRPSLRHAEQVLARLEPWITAGAAVPPYQLAVMGAKRWPPQVVGAAGRRLDALLDEAVFVPHDAEVEVGGVTAELLPDKVLDAVSPLLQDWGLLSPTGRSRSRREGRR